MSKIRTALEQSLALCESMALDDHMKYPQAQRLVPLLRELLEQEEECAHIFAIDPKTNIVTCSVCGVTEADTRPKERGTWSPLLQNGTMLVESSDMTHDVTIRIMGDFTSMSQMREYTKMIANRLNKFSKE